MKRVIKTVCLILALLLAALAAAGCTSTDTRGGIAKDASGNVVLLGEYNQSSKRWLACATKFAGEIPSLTFNGSKISVTSAGANYGQVTVTENHTDNNLTLDANSAVGFLYVQSGATIKVNNTVGLVKNALIESGGVAWFDKMPEMLVIKPGGQAYVGGVLYDNTNGTQDMVLSPNSNSEGSGSAQPALSAPKIIGPDEIHLEVGYTNAEATRSYLITGYPVPTTAMDTTNNSANASIVGNVLSIPTALGASSSSPNTADFTASNTLGTATQAVKVWVYNKLVVSGTTWTWKVNDFQSYDVKDSVNGGSGSFEYSLLAGGSLPNGLALDSSTGKISGIPTVSSNVTVLINVLDTKTLKSASNEFFIKISEP